MTSDDPDWLAVYLEFGRRLEADAALRERWKTIAPQEARDQSRGWIVDGQAAGRLRTDVDAEAIDRFLGVILDGVVVQRALGFETPDAELLLRFTRDAIAAREGTGPRKLGVGYRDDAPLC